VGFLVALGFWAASAFRDWTAVGEADAEEGSTSRGLVGEAAGSAVAVAAVSGLDGAAMADDFAVEPQPATANTESSAPIAMSFVEGRRQCCMRGA
jgi:hypothetical protein